MHYDWRGSWLAHTCFLLWATIGTRLPGRVSPLSAQFEERLIAWSTGRKLFAIHACIAHMGHAAGTLHCALLSLPEVAPRTRPMSLSVYIAGPAWEHVHLRQAPPFIRFILRGIACIGGMNHAANPSFAHHMGSASGLSCIHSAEPWHWQAAHQGGLGRYTGGVAACCSLTHLGWPWSVISPTGSHLLRSSFI